MSPTSASLARFHSTFLLRANSVEPQRPISTRISNSDEQITGGDSGVNEFARVIAGGETIANLGSAVKAAPLTSFMRSDGQGGSVASTRSPRTMKADATLPKMDNTAMALSPRASPPEEARMEGAAVNGTDGEHQKMVVDGFGAETNAISARTLYSCHDNHLSSTPIRHKLHGSGMGIGEDGEPSLPSTPTHLGLEPALESPKGLLYSSPKARPKRSRKTDVKSSPLKQTDSAPEQPVLPQKHLLSSLGPPRFLPNTPRPPPTPEEAHVLRLKNRLADLENNLQDIEDLILREMLVSEWHRKESKDTVEQRKRRKNIVQLCSKVYSVTKEVGKTQAPQGAACSQDMSGGASLRILGETM